MKGRQIEAKVVFNDEGIQEKLSILGVLTVEALALKTSSLALTTNMNNAFNDFSGIKPKRKKELGLQ
ncbi:hypothetical protein J6590_088321 [Homalodisca vitripennis]|nr:hypothetical protein J6590_088321 [Homalodisca vitripennis]